MVFSNGTVSLRALVNIRDIASYSKYREMETPKNADDHSYLNKAVEIAIRLGLLGLLIGWCFIILSPFISLLLWGVIIAVAIHPVFNWLKTKLRGRSKLASIVITLVLLSILLAPSLLVTESLVQGISYLRDAYEKGGRLIPPPDQSVESWPAFTKPIVDLWTLASTSLQSFVIQYKEQVSGVGRWVFSAIAGIGIGVAQFVISIIIAGVLLVYAKSGGEAAERVLVRLVGVRGQAYMQLGEVTIRQVVKGILGVAVIQAALASIGFFVVGVPAAGLWTVLCLILAIVQIGVGPVVIPLIIYMYSVASPVVASLFMIWCILVLVSDNILKPILLGRGAPVPMLVIFLGSVGGFIASGFIGLFLGAVILSLAYKLGEEWLGNSNQPN